MNIAPPIWNLVPALLWLVLSGESQAFNATGHHVIAVIAYDGMSEADRLTVLAILREHPQWEKHFQRDGLFGTDLERWQFGIAACWPDIVRRTAYDRPTWHYQLGASVVLGEGLGVPEHPGPLPDDATLETRSLHVAQAIDLCYQVYLDEDAAAPDRAVALCWVLHLVGDLHQPCHAGSLYAEGVFPGGDRGANSLKLVGGGNLHATWDGLLGGRATPGLIRKRVAELRNEVKEARRNRGPLTPGVWRNWCAHSIELAQTHVYTREVLKPIQLAQRGLIEEIPTYRLSQAYFQNAGKVARKQAAFAGVRLSSMLKLPIESRP